MAQQGSLVEADAWTFDAAEPVQHLAVAPAADRTLVADSGRNIYVLDESGSPGGQFRAGLPVRRLRLDNRGALCAALVGQSVIYAFDAAATLQWRVELTGQVEDFALEPAGTLAAAVGPEGKVHFYSTATRERVVAEVGWPMDSVGVLSGDPPQVAVASARGRLAVLTRQGGTAWDRDLECAIGPIAVASMADLIAVPAGKRGLLLLTAEGETRPPIDLKSPVVRAEMAPDGSLIMAQTQDGGLVLMGADAAVRWRKALAQEPVAWAMGMGGRLVAVCQEGRRAEACRLRVEAPAPSKAPGGAPARAKVGAERLLWKKRLPPDRLPADASAFRLSPDGAFLTLLLAGREIVALDGQGEVAVRAEAGQPLGVAPRGRSLRTAVWGAAEMVVVDPARGNSAALALPGGQVAHLDCSADCGLFAASNREGRVRAFRPDGTDLWAQELDPAPTDLFVSPDGGTVLIADADGRYRYYNAEGELLRKFRFAAERGRRPLALGDGFSVFGSQRGRLTVLDAEGRDVWNGEPFNTISGIELLGPVLAVYGAGGAGALVEPAEGRVLELSPPPGRVRLRTRGDGSPVAVHAAGKAVTAFSGYKRKLDVLWRFECDDEVRLIDVDLGAGVVAALAGAKLYGLRASA